MFYHSFSVDLFAWSLFLSVSDGFRALTVNAADVGTRLDRNIYPHSYTKCINLTLNNGFFKTLTDRAHQWYSSDTTQKIPGHDLLSLWPLYFCPVYVLCMCCVCAMYGVYKCISCSKLRVKGYYRCAKDFLAWQPSRLGWEVYIWALYGVCMGCVWGI